MSVMVEGEYYTHTQYLNLEQMAPRGLFQSLHYACFRSISIRLFLFWDDDMIPPFPRPENGENNGTKTEN